MFLNEIWLDLWICDSYNGSMKTYFIRWAYENVLLTSGLLKRTSYAGFIRTFFLRNGPIDVNGLFSMKAAQTNGFEENWTKKGQSVVLTVNNWSQQTPYNSKFTTQTKWRAKMALSRKMGLRYLTRKLQATERPSVLYRYGTPPFWRCKYF